MVSTANSRTTFKIFGVLYMTIIIINNRIINIQTDYNLRRIPPGVLNNNKIVTEGDVSLYKIQ